MDRWLCEDCDNLYPCVLSMPTDHELTATVCPYGGTDCHWKRVKAKELYGEEDVDSEEAGS